MQVSALRPEVIVSHNDPENFVQGIPAVGFESDSRAKPTMPQKQPKPPKPGAPKYNTTEFKRLTGYSEKTLYRLISEKHIRQQPFRGRWSEEQLQDVIEYKKAVEAGRPSGPARINQTFPVRAPVLKALTVLKEKGKYPNRGAALEHTILHAHVCENFEPGAHNLVVDEQGVVSEVDLSGL